MERYFQKNRKVRTKRTAKAEAKANAHIALTQDEETTGARGRGGRRSRGGGAGGGLTRGDSSLLNSSADNSMQETPVATPPSGLTNGESESHAPAADSRDVSRASSVDRDTEDETASAAATPGKRQSRRNGGHILSKKLKVSISKLNSEEEERASGGGIGSGSGGDQGKAAAASASSKPEIESESSNDASIFDMNAVVTRPIKMTLDAQALLQNGPDDLR